jgi:hypothetical protein
VGASVALVDIGIAVLAGMLIIPAMYVASHLGVDNFADETGKFRVLVSPDKTIERWPKELRVGGGTNSMLLLNDVPVWYELWRVINGFPPDFYIKEPKEEKGKDKKK